MHARFLVHGLAIAIVSGIGIAGDLYGQNPESPKPKPLTIPATRTVPTVKTDAQESVERAQTINPGAFRPDLEVELRPNSSTRPPTTFTVKNSGLGDATQASLLRVTVRLLPLAEGETGAYLGEWSFLGGIGLSPEDFAEWIQEAVAEDCPLPYPDFQAAIDPLAAGASQAISQSGARITGPRSPPAVYRMPSGTPTNTYVKDIQVRLVCVYEVRATVDANREIDETNERNETVHVFTREVTLR